MGVRTVTVCAGALPAPTVTCAVVKVASGVEQVVGERNWPTCPDPRVIVIAPYAVADAVAVKAVAHDEVVTDGAIVGGNSVKTLKGILATVAMTCADCPQDKVTDEGESVRVKGSTTASLPGLTVSVAGMVTPIASVMVKIT